MSFSIFARWVLQLHRSCSTRPTSTKLTRCDSGKASFGSNVLMHPLLAAAVSAVVPICAWKLARAKIWNWEADSQTLLFSQSVSFLFWWCLICFRLRNVYAQLRCDCPPILATHSDFGSGAQKVWRLRATTSVNQTVAVAVPTMWHPLLSLLWQVTPTDGSIWHFYMVGERGSFQHQR